MSRNLITGGMGLLGRSIARQLLEAGEKVILFDTHADFPPSAEDLRDKVEIITGDISNWVHVVEAGIGLETQLGREAQVDLFGELAAQLVPIAGQGLEHALGVDAAERQDEGGRVPQIGRDAHLGHGDRDMRELLVMDVAARQRVGERPADHLCHAELALRGRGAGMGSCLCHSGHILSAPLEVKGAEP